MIYHKPKASKTFHWPSKFYNCYLCSGPTFGDWGGDFYGLTI